MGPSYIYLHERLILMVRVGKYTIVPWIQKGMVESVKNIPDTNKMQLNIHISLQVK